MAQSRRAFGGAKNATTEAMAHLNISYENILGSRSTKDTVAWFERKGEEHNTKVDNQDDFASDGDTRTVVKIDLGCDEVSRRRAFVRLFAGLYREGDDSHVSRVNRALEWVSGRPNLRAARSHQDIVEAVKAAGGYEDIVRQARGGAPKPNAKLSTAASKQVAAELANAAKGAAAKWIASVTEAHTLGNGTHLALIRAGAGTVEVIDHSPVDLDKDGSLLKRFKDGLLPPPPIKGCFLQRMSKLSAVVPEGGMTMLTEGDIWNGTPLLEERVFSLRGDPGRPAEIVISARHVDAGPVVVLEPAEAVGISRSVHDARTMLPIKAWDEMAQVLAVPDIERVIDVTFLPWTPSGSPVWEVYLPPGNADKKPSGQSDKPRIDIVWEVMQPGTWRPLEVVGFEVAASATLSATDLRSLETGIAEGEATAKPESNKAKVSAVNFSCHADTLSVVLGPNVKRDFKLKSELADHLRVFIRVSDLRAVMSALVECAVQEAEWAIDSGAISVTWTDRLGTQSIILPALSTGGGLISTRFRQMAASLPMATETAPIPA